MLEHQNGQLTVTSNQLLEGLVPQPQKTSI
jgi:hypothetical protein